MSSNELGIGHGHVHPRPDGVKARCGGPALCSTCARELASLDALILGAGWLMVLPDGKMRRIDPQTVMIRAENNQRAPGVGK